jgi:hypothetical protein
VSAPKLSARTLAFLPRNGEIRIHDTGVHVMEPKVDDKAMACVWHELRAYFWRRGFRLREDPRFKILMLRRGRKGPAGRELEVKIHVSGRCVDVMFFQNVANVDNRSGGEYDFDKYQRMPQGLRSRCLVEMTTLVRWLEETFGYTRNADLRRLSAASPLLLAIRTLAERREREGLSPLELWERTWGRHGKSWPPADDYNTYGYKDRDGRVMKPGDRRWVYLSGRLAEVDVYPNQNGMWTCWRAGTYLTQASSGELFTWDPARPPARRKRLDPKKLRERLAREFGAAVRDQRWGRVESLGRALKWLDGQGTTQAAPDRRAA